MNKSFKPLLGIAALAFAAHASAQITFYEREGFRGRPFVVDKPVRNFERAGADHHPGSVIVDRGRWEVCEEPRFEGTCVILRRGAYDSLQSMGLENGVASVRPAGHRNAQHDHAPEPVAAPVYEYRQRPQEKLREVPVHSVRAVMGTPEQRCWVERQPVAQAERPDLNVPGAIIGGVLGGILGHQIGGGTGKSVATVGGAVGGAALGANVDRIRGGQTDTRDVRRCENVPNTTPAFYDVTYHFQGQEHRVQMAETPGRTLLVNSRGEPRQ